MSQVNLNAELLSLLKQFLIDNDIQTNEEINEETRLIGNSSIFDSMELVQFIVEVETYVEEKLNMEIQLTSDRAMSRRTSPFTSIKSLNSYISEITNE